MAALLEIHIRRPPCQFCDHGLTTSMVLGLGQVPCSRCHGQAGVVEYSMFLSTSHGVTGRWLEWPGPDQRYLKAHLGVILKLR